jgi:hypothetical protein
LVVGIAGRYSSSRWCVGPQAPATYIPGPAGHQSSCHLRALEARDALEILALTPRLGQFQSVRRWLPTRNCSKPSATNIPTTGSSTGSARSRMPRNPLRLTSMRNIFPEKFRQRIVHKGSGASVERRREIVLEQLALQRRAFHLRCSGAKENCSADNIPSGYNSAWRSARFTL